MCANFIMPPFPFLLSLHKIGGTQEIENRFSFHSFALSLQKRYKNRADSHKTQYRIWTQKPRKGAKIHILCFPF